MAASRLTWQIARVPLLALAMLFEPVLRAVLSLAMVLGVLVAIVFEQSAASARFEFLQMLAISLGLGAALFVYYAVLALLSR